MLVSQEHPEHSPNWSTAKVHHLLRRLWKHE